MRGLLILLFIIFTTFSGFAQLLTLSQLEYLASQDDWQVINNYLLTRGWKFVTADSTMIVWAYNPSEKFTLSDDPVDKWEAEAWFSIFLNQWNGIDVFGYQFSGETEHYNALLNSLKSKGYVKERQFINNGTLNFVYSNKKYKIVLAQELGEANYSGNPSQQFYVVIKKL